MIISPALQGAGFFLLNYIDSDNLCSVAADIITDRKRKRNMENKENNTNKVTETLVKELESLSKEELHEFFMFFYKLNHQHGNMLSVDQFEEFLEALDSNPFKVNEEKAFKKQLIKNILEYSHDHMSLITAAMLIKKKFTMDELTQNYYSSVNVFDNTSLLPSKFIN